MDESYEKSEIGSSIKNEDDTTTSTMTHTDVQLYLIFEYIMIKISKERVNLNVCKYYGPSIYGKHSKVSERAIVSEKKRKSLFFIFSFRRLSSFEPSKFCNKAKALLIWKSVSLYKIHESLLQNNLSYQKK